MIFVAFLQIWLQTQAATKTLDVFNTRSLNQNSYLPPINSNNANNISVAPLKTYITKTQRSIDNFNTRPDLKNSKSFTTTTYPPLFNSYAPPPSGLVSHKNLQLPLGSTVKLPLLLPQPVKTNDFAKHPGFVAAPPIPQTRNLEDSSSAVLMVEEPTTVILQAQYNKTIEAAKVLASTFLEATTESSKDQTSSTTVNNNPLNSTDIFLVKTQKKAYIIPTHLKKEASKPSAVDELYPLRDQFEKAYTINQFIFVIKPEKINFLNKL
ncbi:hypothetical protein DOY81_008154, partial [Sarcophaga bullata]